MYKPLYLIIKLQFYSCFYLLGRFKICQFFHLFIKSSKVNPVQLYFCYKSMHLSQLIIRPTTSTRITASSTLCTSRISFLLYHLPNSSQKLSALLTRLSFISIEQYSKLLLVTNMYFLYYFSPFKYHCLLVYTCTFD